MTVGRMVHCLVEMMGLQNVMASMKVGLKDLTMALSWVVWKLSRIRETN